MRELPMESSFAMLEEVADEQGWGNDAELTVACAFVDERGLQAEFKRFLADRVKEEQAMSDTFGGGKDA